MENLKKIHNNDMRNILIELKTHTRGCLLGRAYRFCFTRSLFKSTAQILIIHT